MAMFACFSPGRHFASYEVKSVMIHLIRNYDMKLPGGVERRELVTAGHNILPDFGQEILLKRIR